MTDAEDAPAYSSFVVDAAFCRYAREATNYAGGRTREVIGRAHSPADR